MKIRQVLIMTFCLISANLFGQTKMIAHKSHSGNIKTFKTSMEKNLFDIKNSSFGAAPRRVIETAELDSVIFVSDTVAVMVTSNYCEDRIEGDTTLWRAGKDTVYHHPLFTQKHSLDSIKNVLKKVYYFKNPIDNVKFIGFDNKKNISKRKENIKNETITVVCNDKYKKHFDHKFFVVVVVIGLFSLLAGFLPGRFPN